MRIYLCQLYPLELFIVNYFSATQELHGISSSREGVNLACNALDSRLSSSVDKRGDDVMMSITQMRQRTIGLAKLNL